MKYLIIVVFLIISHTANAQNSPFQQNKIQQNTSNLLNYQKDESILKSKKQMSSLLSRKRNSKKMPNLFVGGNYMNFNMGRFAGFFSYSIDAVYNHELFSAQARSTFAYNVSPKTDEFLMDKYPNAYRTFNITEVFGTYFLFSYKSK